MMTPCARWVSLSERELVEEPLREDELHFLEKHERECEPCRKEAALLRDLRPTALHVVPTHDEVQRLLARADSAAGDDAPPPHGHRPHGRGTRLLAVAGFVSLAASALVYWAGWGTRFGSSAPSPAAAPSLTGAPMRTHSDSCGALLEGVVICLTAGSEIQGIELSGPHRGLDLTRGRALIAITAAADGASFAVSTAAGSAVGSGGVFSVEAGADGSAWARATLGLAVVRSKGAHTSQTLLAGQALRLGESSVTALSEEQKQRDLELLDRWKKVTH